MKLWKYIHFSEITETIAAGKPIKEPFVWSETAPDSDYDDITTNEFIIERIKVGYKQYEKDGKDYFEEIRAKLVLLYQTQQKTAVEIFIIESLLEQTINKIVRGDWMTASNALSNVVVQEPLDQELYDEINNFIIDYIANNY